MKLAILESPFRSADPAEAAKNVEYARALMRHLLKNGIAPYASHLLYTQPGVLDDNDPGERELGIEAGLVWASVIRTVYVGIDRGISEGMRYGIDRHEREGRTVLMLSLPEWRLVDRDGPVYVPQTDKARAAVKRSVDLNGPSRPFDDVFAEQEKRRGDEVTEALSDMSLEVE